MGIRRYVLLVYVLFFAGLVPGSGMAQAPVVTPAGDPSIDDHDLYRRAAPPEEHVGHDYLLLFDDGVVIVGDDGTRSTTYRQVAQVLTKDGAQQWAELAYSYQANRERLRLNWARVLSADGTLLNSEPRHEQETSVPASQDVPVYSDRRVRRYTMAAVTPGVLVDVSVTIETLDPALVDDFRYTWYVNQMIPVSRSRFVVEVPAALTPRIRETNLDFRRRAREVDRRVVYEWETRDVPAVEYERFAGFPNDIAMAITISGPTGWDDIARWYTDLNARDDTIDARVLDGLVGVLRGSRTLTDSLRAVHRWVAQDIRYVSLSLEDGGYRARAPAEVFDTKFGDCKDKTTLFISVLRRMGVRAYPVLTRSGGYLDTQFPSLSQVDHMIAAIDRYGRYEFVDLTAPFTPFGDLPPHLQAQAGVLLRPEGRAEVVVFPATEPKMSIRETRIAGELTDSGLFVGTLAVLATGAEQYWLRDVFAELSTDEELFALSEEVAYSLFSTAVVDSALAGDAYDLAFDPVLLAWFSADDVVTAAGTKRIFTLPLPDYSAQSLIAALEQDAHRDFPIDVGEFNGPSMHRTELTVSLPAGWRVELPQNVDVEGTFGTYRARYSQQGRLLTVIREMTGRSGLAPPDSVGAWIEWIRAVSADRVRHLVLELDHGVATADSLSSVDIVLIEFAWPGGLRADVTQRRVNIRREGDAPADSTDVATAYRLTVHDHAEGLLIELSDFEALDPLRHAAVDPTAAMEVLTAAPSYVVSRDGELLRLEGFEPFIEARRAEIALSLDTMPEHMHEFRAFAERVTSEDFFFAQALEEWTALIGFWNGAELEIGMTYGMESNEPIQVLPGTMIPFDYAFRLESRVPCADGRTDSACVLLIAESAPDPEAMKAMLTGMFAETLELGAAGGDYIESIEIHNEVRLVSEPATLIPHHLSLVQHVAVVMRDSAGEATRNAQVRSRVFEYRYGPAEVSRGRGGSALPLVAAAAAGDVKRVAQLLEAGADVDGRDVDGTPAIVAAARQGHEKVVRLLLYRGARVDATDRAGLMALVVAAERQHVAVVRRLVDAGADVDAAFRAAQNAGLALALPHLLRAGATPVAFGDAPFDSAMAHYQAGDLDRALRGFTDVVARDTSDADGFAWIAETLRRLGHPERAVRAANRALRLAACHAIAHTTLGDAYQPQYAGWDGVDADSTWIHYAQAVECDPDEGNAWLGIVFEAMRRGEVLREREALRRLTETGFFTPLTTAVARWLLVSLPDSAVLIVSGDLDTYPLLALQVTEGYRRDVAVVNWNLLNLTWYRDTVAARHGLPVPAAGDTAWIDPAFVLAVPADTIIALWRTRVLEGIVQRPLTWAVTAGMVPADAGPGAFRSAGPVYVLEDSAGFPNADLPRVRRAFEGISARDVAGPVVAPRDRSPLRRNSAEHFRYALFAAGLFLDTFEKEDFDRLDPEALSDVAYLLDWIERYARESGPQFQSLIPDLASGHVQLSYEYGRRGLVEEAWDRASRAAQMAPNLQAAHSNIGYYGLRLGRVDSAISHLEISRDMAPRVGTYLSLANAYRLLGDFEWALRVRREADATGMADSLVDGDGHYWNYLPEFPGDMETVRRTIAVTSGADRAAILDLTLTIDLALTGDLATADEAFGRAEARTTAETVRCYVANTIRATLGHVTMPDATAAWMTATLVRLTDGIDCAQFALVRRSF